MDNGNMKKILDSGKELCVTVAPFAVGHKLLKSVVAELESVKFSMGFADKNFENFLDMDITDEAIDTLKNMISRMISSEKVEECLWACMERATYGNQDAGKKITKDTFEDIESRADFLIVAKEVLWFNLRPFVKNLGSMLSGIMQTRKNTLKS